MQKKFINFKVLGTIVKEFIRALAKPHTYNIRKNYYFIFGILWGLPVPVVTIGMGIYYKDMAFSLSNIITHMAANPTQIFFLIHPLLFGIVFGAMGTVRDDKEKQSLEFKQNLIELNKELKVKNEKLQELDQLKDNFLSMISHELWSPLTTIEGYITFMKNEKAGRLSLKQKEILTIAEEQIEQLNHLIGELIDISKIEANKFEVLLECLDMKESIAKVISSFRQRANEKNIIFDDKSPKEISCVLADRKGIAQVLTNIFGNAIKFTPEKGRVSIYVREKKNTVEFLVKDSGVGIPKDKINRVFDKFYQVDSTGSRKYGGCGLGLAITKSIIDLHQGKIWVESELGKGSNFIFELKKYIGN